MKTFYIDVVSLVLYLEERIIRHILTVVEEFVDIIKARYYSKAFLVKGIEGVTSPGSDKELRFRLKRSGYRSY